MNKYQTKSWIIENIDCMDKNSVLAGNNTHIYTATEEESTKYVIVEYMDENYCITIDVNKINDSSAQFYSECLETNDVTELIIDLSDFSGWINLENTMKNILGNVTL